MSIVVFKNVTETKVLSMQIAEISVVSTRNNTGKEISHKILPYTTEFYAFPLLATVRVHPWRLSRSNVNVFKNA